jgi:hypothetical protein
MKTNPFKFLMMAALSVALLGACKKDKNDPKDPNDPNPEELITTVILHFTDTAGVAPSATFTFSDPDGPGGNPPVLFEDIVLKANTVYRVDIELLDESKNPVDDITEEVLAEADEHLFCFEVNGASITIVRTDTDGTYELGLESLWTVGAAGSGSVTVILKHQPDGMKDGSCAPGETDVELEFQVTVQP